MFFERKGSLMLKKMKKNTGTITNRSQPDLYKILKIIVVLGQEKIPGCIFAKNTLIYLKTCVITPKI